MIFYWDKFGAEEISGWVIPNNPRAVPRIAIEVEGKDTHILPANVFRPDIVDACLHETGEVGFHIDLMVVPNLEGAGRVAIRELDQNICLFKTNDFQKLRDFSSVQRAYLFTNLPNVETQLFSKLGNQFDVSYSGLEEFGRDTALAVLSNPAPVTIFSHGLINLNTELQKLRALNFKFGALLMEPYRQLAFQMLVVRALEKQGFANGLDAVSSGLNHIRAMVNSISEFTPGAINAAIEALDEGAKASLNNPLTSALGGTSGVPAAASNVPVALSTLSQFSFVGTVEDFPAFKRVSNEVMPGLELPKPKFANSASIDELAQTLSKCRRVSSFLALDLRLYRYVKNSVDMSMAMVSDNEQHLIGPNA